MSEAMAMQPRREMTTPDADLLAAAFEENRRHLRTVAYRMLGSVSDADDAVQEVWLRLNRSDSDSISNLPGWLTAVVARVCLDMLRARRARHEDYVGSWLPEPIVRGEAGEADPEYEALVGTASASHCSSSSTRSRPRSGSLSSCTTCSRSRSARL